MNASGTSTNVYSADQSNMSTINNLSTENCWSEGPPPSSSRVHREPFAPVSMNREDSHPRYRHNDISESNQDGSIEKELLDDAWNDGYTDHHDHMDNYYHNTMEGSPAQTVQVTPIPMIQEHFYGNEEGCYVDENLPVYQEPNYGEVNNTTNLVMYTDPVGGQYDDSMAIHHHIGNDGGAVFQEHDDGEQQMDFKNTPYQYDEAANSVMPSTDFATTVSSTIGPTQCYSRQQLDNLLNAEVSEDIDTVDLCRCISSELKNSTIPQHVFAKKILGRSQGTLSDLLKHPKPFNSLKACGKLTFRRMHNWMIQPLEMRFALLDVNGDEGSEESTESSRPNPPKRVQRKRKPTLEEPASKRSRVTFTEIQKDTLRKLFEKEQRPSSDVQQTIANHLGLEFCQVQNFYMNSRRRVGRQSIKAERQNSTQEGNFEEEYEQ